MLYETDHMREKTTAREQIVYRISVENIVGSDDHLFRFEWVHCPLQFQLTTQDDELRRLGIQLLNKTDLTLDQAETREEQWAYYVDSYYMHAATEGVATDISNPPWVRRSIFPNETVQDPAVISSDLQVKICLNTYKLFYLVNTEDTFVRSVTNRAVRRTRFNYNRAARKADGKKWTQDGHTTKEEENAKAALEAARAQNVVPHPSSIGAAPANQTSPPAPSGSSVTPAPQPEQQAAPETPAPSVPVPEEVPPVGDIKTESPLPLASEPGEAMDIEDIAPVVPEAPREEKVEDVEMTDA
jgi:hypothetical protein